MQLISTPLAGVDYNLQGPFGAAATIAGLPVGFSTDANGYYAAAVFQNVNLQGAPVVAYFDPPVATVAEISLPGLLTFLTDTLANGAIIQPF